MSNDDISRNANVSLKQSLLDITDKYRVGHGKNKFQTRSQYVQNLIVNDLFPNRFTYFSEMVSMTVLPMMFFGFFMVIAVLTKGLLFFIFMGISGVFAVVFTVAYSMKNKPIKKQKEGK